MLGIRFVKKDTEGTVTLDVHGSKEKVKFSFVTMGSGKQKDKGIKMGYIEDYPSYNVISVNRHSFGAELPEGAFIIKNCTENIGLVSALVEAGVLVTANDLNNNYVICTVDPEFEKFMEVA